MRNRNTIASFISKLTGFREMYIILLHQCGSHQAQGKFDSLAGCDALSPMLPQISNALCETQMQFYLLALSSQYFRSANSRCL
ncbi:hypothetical protein BRADI_5g18688v3 [Brachypodium distachyon]|uniref:Uncharacterized protein n=1 Tax=Brachypodium distachyon TaxID=15368 RepID=A0A2K2CI29_BRADI|nr:hypothetical protein BRADI_5g18688v3 [Brachypodium distachyon]